MKNNKRVLNAGFDTNCNPFSKLSPPFSNTKIIKTKRCKKEKDEFVPYSFMEDSCIRRAPLCLPIFDIGIMYSSPRKIAIYESMRPLIEEAL